MSSDGLSPAWDERVRADVARAPAIPLDGDGRRPLRLAIVSDAHGSLTALEDVAADVGRRGIDRVLVAGDVAQAGPQPAEVVDFLIDRGWPTVLGNSDALLLDVADGRFEGGPDLRVLAERAAWSVARLGEAGLAFLRGLPGAIRCALPGGRRLLVVHATPWSIEAVVLPEAPVADARRMIEEGRADVVAYGHIHAPYRRRVGPSLLLSAGAIWGSNDQDPRSAYTIVTAGETITAESVRVPRDVAREIAAVDRSGMPHAGRYKETLGRPGPRPVRG